jgi:hypothetical protein
MTSLLYFFMLRITVSPPGPDEPVHRGIMPDKKWRVKSIRP